MGTYPKEPVNRRSTHWRNELRKLWARLTYVTKDDGTGLEDDIVTEASISDASIAMSKMKFPPTGINLLPKKYSSFAALEGSAPSADLYVVSGTFTTAQKTTTNRLAGTHSLLCTVTSGGGTIALCTGASDYPIGQLSGAFGTWHTLSFFYRRGTFSGHTFVVQLRFSDGSTTQTLSGTLTPNTSYERFVSDPFELVNTSLPYRLEFVLTAAATRQIYIAEAMLSVSSSASVTEVGPWIPGANWYADEVDARTLRIVSGYFQAFGTGGTAIYFDTSKVDSQGRIVTLRQSSADLPVANIIHDDGSGLEKNNATIDLLLASGKTITVGSTTIVNSSGVIQSRRTLHASSTEVLSGGATPKEATTSSTSYVTFEDGAVYILASERAELNIQLWASTGVGEQSYCEFDVNGQTGEAFTTSGSNEWQTKQIVVNPGSSGLLVFKIKLKSTDAGFTAKARYWVIDGKF